MKLCKDCKWAVDPRDKPWSVKSASNPYKYCDSPQASHSFVNGYANQHCDINRGFGGCGPEGRWWEAKET